MRIVQEALMNAHRHAGASEVHIEARRRGGWLRISVRDNGCGMRSDMPAGVGIAGMRWRLKQAGGRLSIRTGPNGTAIVASVPLMRSRSSHSRTDTGRADKTVLSKGNKNADGMRGPSDTISI
jgi:signal transduction histidine kinase